MNLFFSQPAFLAAAALASLPIIIHLINRRRAIVVQFAAIDFVMRSNKKLARKFKIKQFLLLLFRTLALLALAAALAKPFFSDEQPADAVADGGPKSVVYIIDVSAGMRYERGGESLYEKAMELVADRIDEADPVDSIGLLACAAGPVDPKIDPTFDRNELKQGLRMIEATYAAGDIPACVEFGRKMLAAAEAPRKELALVTDLTKTGYLSPTGAEKSEEIELVNLHIFDVAAGAVLDNRAIIDVSTSTVYKGEGSALEAKIAAARFGGNYSGEREKQSFSVSVKTGPNSAARGFIELAPGERVEKIFTVALADAGGVSGEAVADGDSLAIDDVRHFVFRAGGSFSILLVDGDPGEGPYDSELYFLEKALSPSKFGHGDATIKVVDQSAIESLKLADFSVIFLANVGNISRGAAARLKGFVSDGGGLFISLGDKISPENFNSALGALLPRQLWGERTEIVESDSGQSFSEPARLDPYRIDGEIFNFLKEGGRVNLRTAKFSRYFQFQSDGDRRARTLLTFDDGSPALLYKEYGAGGVMLYASTIDQAWSNFAIKPVFLPIVHRSTRYLAGLYRPEKRHDYLIGEPITIDSLAESITVRLPGERIEEIQAIGGKAVFSRTDRPGVYTFSPSDGSDTEVCVVNIDPAESNVERLTVEEAALALGFEQVKLTSAGSGEGSAAGSKKELWGLLLITMFLFIGLEGLIAFLI